MKEKNKIRNAYAISTISVTLVLFLVGAALYFLANATKATDAIIEQIKITLVLEDECSEEQKISATKFCEGLESVSKVEYLSKEDAIKDFSKFIGEDVITSFDVNPLPAALNVYFKKDAEHKLAISKIKKEFEGKEYIEDIIHQTDEVDQIMNNLSDLKLLMSIFGAVLLFISVVLINNTIRMNIFAKRFIIRTMLLIGATPWFIRKPFLGKALLQGFIASLLAFVMLMIMIMLIKRTIPMAELIDGADKFIIIFGIMSLVGMLMCMLLTNISVGYYMRSSREKLYTY